MSRTNRAVASLAMASCILASVVLPAVPASAEEAKAPASDTARAEPKASPEQTRDESLWARRVRIVDGCLLDSWVKD